MQLPSFDRTYVTPAAAQTAAVTLLTVAALALLALVGSHWTWEWLAPDAASRAPAATDGIDHAKSAGALFGIAPREADRPSPTGVEPRLLGVVASTAGGRGYAVLRIEPRQIITVEEGSDVAPGLRLAAIGVDHVILERGGIRETLSWPSRATTTEPLASRIGK